MVEIQPCTEFTDDGEMIVPLVHSLSIGMEANGGTAAACIILTDGRRFNIRFDGKEHVELCTEPMRVEVQGDGHRFTEWANEK